jgi:endonuclease/exonuclease/phosphatase family metal-dependent hydrolase
MKELCRFDVLCTRANCSRHHTCTANGESPETEKCRYGFECTRKKCPFRHDTLDGLSPRGDVVGRAVPPPTSFHVELVTWNILSEIQAAKMGPSEHYCEKVLDTEFRWSLLRPQLLEWMQKGFILCLQEVTRPGTLEKLEALASDFSYHVVYETYGSMGNAVLVPPRFHIENIHHIRVGAVCTLSSAQGFPQLLTSVLLKEKETETKFFVTTYHMPCQYKKPEIIKAHAEALVCIFSTARCPFILAGDLNMTREEAVFHFPFWNLLEDNSPTTHSCIRDTVFKGRLDHILWKFPGVEIKEEIPVVSVDTLMPNDTQPSDHACVAAVFHGKN